MRRQLFILVGLLFGPVLAVSWSGYGRVAEAQPVASLDTESVPSTAQVEQALQSSPLMFIENVGQFAEDARFQVRGGNRTIWLAEDAIWVTILEPAATEARPDHKGDFRLEAGMEGSSRQGVNIRLSFVGANPAARIEPFAPIETTISYFTGNDPAGWRPDVPVWGTVRYVDLYPGLDLELSGSEAIRPRLVCRVADCATALANLTLQVEGAEELIAEEAGLSIATTVGNFSLPWLEIVDAAGRLMDIGGAAPTVTTDLVQRPLVSRPPVQPMGNRLAGSNLLYSTFLGGWSGDTGSDIEVDWAGNVYVTGYTTLFSNFPTTPGAFDTTYNGGDNDAFVTKLDPTGSTLLYSTFLGSSSADVGLSIAIDDMGNAFVTGAGATGFPVTPGAFDTTHNGGWDTFVTKLNPTGSGLLYSTFLGGGDLDQGWGIAVDGEGNAFVTGETWSTNYPITPGAFDTVYNGGLIDTYITKLDSTGSTLLYSTFLGGGNLDRGQSIAVDDAGNAFVAGYTESTDFPTTPGAFDTTFDSNRDVFVTKLTAVGSNLLYSTFLGGSDLESGDDITIDEAGNAFVAGHTQSTDFPTTPGAFDTTFNGDRDVFVTRLNPTGSGLLYSTFLGGGDTDSGPDISVNGAGNAFITGYTESTDFPTTPNGFDTTHSAVDAFVARLNAAGSSLLYSTFLGGEGWDGGNGIAVDEAGNAFIVGSTTSTDFPTTPGAFDTTYNNGVGDAFVVSLALADGGDELAGDIVALIANSNEQIQLASFQAVDVIAAGDYFLDELVADTTELVVNTIMDTWTLRGVDWSQVKPGLKNITFSGYKATLNDTWEGWTAHSAAARHWYKPLYDSIHHDQQFVFNGVTRAGLQYYSEELVEGPVKDWLLQTLVSAPGTPITDALAAPSEDLANSYQVELLNEQSLILAELSQLNLSPQEIAAYQADMAARQEANNQMVAQLTGHRDLIWESYQDSLEDEASWWNFWGPMLSEWIVVGACTLTMQGAGYYLATAGVAIYDAVSGTRELMHDAKMLDQSLRFLTGRVPLTYSQIALNSVGALNIIRAGVPPQIAEGTIGTVTANSYGHYRIWPNIWWAEERSQVEIPVTNSGNYSTTYLTSAAYTTTSFWVGPQRFLPEGNTPELEPDTPGTAIIGFKGEDEGLSPDEGSIVDLLILGATETGLYPVEELSIIWEPERVESLTGRPGRIPAGYTEAQAANAPAYAFPLSSTSVVAYGTTNQQLIISASNPFSLTVAATLTQTIPSDFTIVDPAGATLVGNSLVWTEILTPGLSLEVRPILHWEGPLGSSTILPGAQLAFEDPDTGEGDMYIAADEEISTPWPIEVATELPPTLRSGKMMPASVTLNNISTNTFATGEFIATVSTPEGEGLWSIVLPINVAPQETQTFSMPIIFTTDEKYVVVSGSVVLGTVEQAVFLEIIPVESGKVYLPIILDSN